MGRQRMVAGVAVLVVSVTTGSAGLASAAATPLGAAPAPSCVDPQQQTTPTVLASRSGYLPQLQPQRAWAITRGQATTVALLDTGVSAGVARAGAALAGRVRDGGNVAGDAGRTALHDCDGRGTADAGLIAAADQPGRLPGIAPAATLVAIRVQVGSDTPPSPAAMTAGFERARQARAGVIVVAAPCAASAGLEAAVARAVRSGVIVIAAVGDQGRSRSSYPSTYPGVVGVTMTPGAGGWATEVAGNFVDLNAPGSGLAGLAVSGSGYRLNVSGTAAAAAVVGGVAALLHSAYPRQSAAVAGSRLQHSADHPPIKVPDPHQGWGTVNPYAALTQSLTATAPPSPPAAQTAGPVSLPPRDNPHHRYVGALIAIGLVALSVAAVAGVAALRAARRRGWQPGGTP